MIKIYSATNLEDFTKKVIKAGETNGAKEIFESNPMYHTPNFWNWFNEACIIGLTLNQTPEQVAELIFKSLKEVADNPPEDLKRINSYYSGYIEYARKVTQELEKLQFNEFYENNQFLHTNEFITFFQSQIETGFRLNISPEIAARILDEQIRQELSPERFMNEFSFGKTKH